MSGDLAHKTVVNIRPKLLLNRVRNRAQIEERHRFMGIVKDFLCLELDYIGHIRSDSRVLDACERRRPVLIDAPTAPASKDIYSVLLDGMKLGSMGGEPVENKADQLVRRAESQAGCW
jgi:MinD-like ATPase involved in chromosome partitioning or flagellar assembly